ncbi:MAG TPA: right-handed parallel beta-helix repeat-containing protein, partial [Polyangiaceae bacterium]|nr:right-handed parallel beta-helix repeat-containing protein [Polyangiaceae bacterium]
GIVAGNVVRETGDDMIAVVNYGLGAPTVGNVLIEENDVSGQYWGRGITVVGGRDVTIRNNRISRTTVGAGILIHSETSYDTADVRNVMIEGNVIRQVQTTAPVYNPEQKNKETGHAAIDVYGQGSQHVSQVLIRNNTIEDVAHDGVQVRGNACDIGISGNKLSLVGGDPIYIASESDQSCPVSCSDNTLSGALVSDPSCRTGMPQVTGASVLD